MQSKIISRHFLRQDLEYHEDDQIYRYDDFVDSINKWKNILYYQYNMRPGMSACFIDMSVYFEYCTLFIAAAELGIRTLCIPERPKTPDGRVPKLDQVINEIGLPDLMYYYSEESIVLQAKTMAMPQMALVNMAARYSSNLMTFDDYVNYNAADYDKALNDQILATEENILSWTTTSGTTGDPKPIEYNHRQLYDIAQRNAQVFGFDQPGISVSHTRNMHHAAILMANFLPAFGWAQYHHSLRTDYNQTDVEFAEQFVDFVNRKGTNKVLLPFSLMLEAVFSYIKKNNIKFNHAFDVIVGGFNITKTYVEAFQATNINKIMSMFGSNETLGPVLVRIIDHNTGVDNYDPTFLGTPVDDMYNIRITDQQLIAVTCPVLFNDEIVMGDMAQGNDVTGYYHLGRPNITKLRFNEVEFYVNEIRELIKSIMPDLRFEVVADTIGQKLYVAVWQGTMDIDLLNQRMMERYDRLTISDWDYLNLMDYDKFKIDVPALIEYFRNKGTVVINTHSLNRENY
jgi:acyl-CoA synthetase (AMP-forming)/AMP-acid ligase II